LAEFPKRRATPVRIAVVDPDSLDRDFLRYRQSRDPAALAAVFDAAAPRLLLVAMHLVRDTATAEDLVQTVFLQLLRDAERLDSRRPVLPWLLGVLEHRAVDLRRRHRAAPAGHKVAGAVARAASPEHEAVAEETRQRIAEALGGMPRDYRDVLTLRLVHGLSAVQIGQSLGTSPATIRTRLRRGLQLLRGALPRGLATPALLVWLGSESLRASDGLQAVRAKVLAAAGGGAVATAGWLWLVAAVVVLLPLGGAFAWGVGRDGSSASWEPRASVQAAVGEAAANDAPRAPGDDAAAGAERSAPRDARLTRVHGKVVAAEDGRPLAGATVTLRSYRSFGGWNDPDPATTGDDGTFAFEYVPSPDSPVDLCAVAVGRVHDASSRVNDPLRQGVDVDAGAIELKVGTDLLLLVERDGEPWPGVQVSFGRREHPAERARSCPLRTTDGQGRIAWGVVEPGVYDCEVKTGFPGGESTVEVPLQAAPLQCVVRVASPPRERSIRGVLLDTDGHAVAGVEVGYGVDRGFRACRTDGLGRFELVRNVLDPPTVRLRLVQDPRDLVVVEDGGDLAWGASARMVARRLPASRLRLEVVDAATGAPVEKFGASCWPDAWTQRTAWPWQFLLAAIATTHPGGVAELDGLLPGAALVSVFPLPPYAEVGERRLVLEPGRTASLRIELAPPHECEVMTVDRLDGTPVQGAEVVLAKVLPQDRLAEVRERMWRANLADVRSGWRSFTGTQLVELARGVTDARGCTTLRVPRDVPSLVLIAEGPLCQRTLQKGVVLPAAGARLSIAVDRAGALEGRVVPAAFLECFGPSAAERAERELRARIAFVHEQELLEGYPEIALIPERGTEPVATVAVRPDGSFAIGGVPPGRYGVGLEVTSRINDGSDVTSFTDSLGPITTIDVAAGQRRDPLVVDASAFLPGMLTVRVFVDGEPFAGPVRLLNDRTVVYLRTDPSGEARSPWLVPGIYYVSVPFGTRGWGCAALDPAPIHVGPGARVVATATMKRRPVTVALRDASGSPMRDGVVFLRALDHPTNPGTYALAWPDDSGVAAFAAMPPGRLQVLLLTPQQADARALEHGEVLGELDAATNTFEFVRAPRPPEPRAQQMGR